MAASSNSSNSYQRDVCVTVISFEFPYTLQVVQTIVCAILSLVTVTSNHILIYTLYKTKQLSTISNKLILIMSFSDLFSGLFALPHLSIMFFVKNIPNRCTYEKIAAYTLLLSAYFSFYLLSCISIDRYLQVTKFARYSLYMNKSRMTLMVILSFILSNIIAIRTLLHPSFAQQIIINCFDVSIMVSSTIIYTFLINKLHNHVKHIDKTLQIRVTEKSKKSNEGLNEASVRTVASTSGSKTSNSNTAQNTSVSYLSAARVIRALIIFSIVTYMPYKVSSIAWTYYKVFKRDKPDLTLSLIYGLSCGSVILNASGNACIIIYGNKKSRRFVSAMIRRNLVSDTL